MKTKGNFLILPTLFLAMVSCVSMKEVTPAPAMVLPRIRPKDNVQLLLRGTGKMKHMKVASIDSLSLVGHISGKPKGSLDTIRIQNIEGIQRQADHRELYVIKVGSTVKIVMNGGEQIMLTVQKISEEEISGVVVSYTGEAQVHRYLKRSNIKSIKIEVPDLGKSVLVIVVPVIVITFLLAFQRAFGG